MLLEQKLTTQRIDKHSTEYGLWTRGQLPGQKTKVSVLDSSVGFVASNIDFVWRNYKTNEWMLIEEKRYGCQPKPFQYVIYKILDSFSKEDIFYKGFHLLIFEKTNPEDGKMTLNHEPISPNQLVKFLQFKWFSAKDCLEKIKLPDAYKRNIDDDSDVPF